MARDGYGQILNDEREQWRRLPEEHISAPGRADVVHGPTSASIEELEVILQGIIRTMPQAQELRAKAFRTRVIEHLS